MRVRAGQHGPGRRPRVEHAERARGAPAGHEDRGLRGRPGDVLDGARRRRPLDVDGARAARVQAQRGHAAVVRAAREAGVVAPLQAEALRGPLRDRERAPLYDPRGPRAGRAEPLALGPRVPDQHGAAVGPRRHEPRRPLAGRHAVDAARVPEGDVVGRRVRVPVVVVVAVVVGLVLVGVLLQAPQALQLQQREPVRVADGLRAARREQRVREPRPAAAAGVAHEVEGQAGPVAPEAVEHAVGARVEVQLAALCVPPRVLDPGIG